MSTDPKHAVLPLHSLLEKDLASMTREEVAQYTQHIRLLRTSPPTLAKTLRDDPDIDTEASEPKTKRTRAAKQSTQQRALDFMSGLDAAAGS